MGLYGLLMINVAAAIIASSTCAYVWQVPTKCWHCISTMDKGCEPFDEYTLGAERLHECWPNGPCVVATSKNTVNGELYTIRSCSRDDSEAECTARTNGGKCQFCSTSECNNATKTIEA